MLSHLRQALESIRWIRCGWVWRLVDITHAAHEASLLVVAEPNIVLHLL